MKRCPQCQQIYSDETNFCLADGATLAPVSGSYNSESDMPTVVREVPAPTVYSPVQTSPSYGQNQPPPPYSGAPFVPPVASAPAEQSSTLLIAALVGLLALVVGGAIVGAMMYGVFKTDNKNETGARSANTNDKTSQSPSPEKTAADEDERAEKLKQDREKLEKDRQKLEEERKRLEAQKKQTPPPSSTATTAVIIDPPSNIRAAPNGSVLCVARTRGTIVNILGSTGITDNNGTWYHTDYCGRQGVIHSTQIRF